MRVLVLGLLKIFVFTRQLEYEFQNTYLEAQMRGFLQSPIGEKEINSKLEVTQPQLLIAAPPLPNAAFETMNKIDCGQIPVNANTVRFISGRNMNVVTLEVDQIADKTIVNFHLYNSRTKPCYTMKTVQFPSQFNLVTFNRIQASCVLLVGDTDIAFVGYDAITDTLDFFLPQLTIPEYNQLAVMDPLKVRLAPFCRRAVANGKVYKLSKITRSTQIVLGGTILASSTHTKALVIGTSIYLYDQTLDTYTNSFTFTTGLGAGVVWEIATNNNIISLYGKAPVSGRFNVAIFIFSIIGGVVTQTYHFQAPSDYSTGYCREEALEMSHVVFLYSDPTVTVPNKYKSLLLRNQGGITTVMTGLDRHFSQAIGETCVNGVVRMTDNHMMLMSEFSSYSNTQYTTNLLSLGTVNTDYYAMGTAYGVDTVNGGDISSMFNGPTMIRLYVRQGNYMVPFSVYQAPIYTTTVIQTIDAKYTDTLTIMTVDYDNISANITRNDYGTIPQMTAPTPIITVQHSSVPPSTKTFTSGFLEWNIISQLNTNTILSLYTSPSAKVVSLPSIECNKVRTDKGDLIQNVIIPNLTKTDTQIDDYFQIVSSFDVSIVENQIVNTSNSIKILATSSQCKLLFLMPQNRIVTYKLNNTYSEYCDGTDGMKPLLTETFQISSDCDAVYCTGGRMWLSSSIGGNCVYAPANKDLSLLFKAVSPSLQWAATTTTIYHLIPFLKQYFPLIQRPSFTTAAVSLWDSCRGVLFTSTITTAGITTLILEGVSFNPLSTQILAFFSTIITSSAPMRTLVSPQLRLSIIIPSIATPTLPYRLFSIDFSTNTGNQIQLPEYFSDVVKNMNMMLSDHWIVCSALTTVTQPSPDKLVFQVHPRLGFLFLTAYAMYNTTNSMSFNRNLLMESTSWPLLMITSDWDINQTVSALTLHPVISRVPSPSLQSQGGIFIALNKQYRCQAACLTCATADTCYLCKLSFVLSAGNCLKCGLHCSVCLSTASNTCTLCERGAFLNGGICTLCDAGCLTCSGIATNCTSCALKQYLTTTSVCAPCDDSHCLRCIGSSSLCMTCQMGYSPSQKGLCVQCIDNCASCDPKDFRKCISCGPRYEKVDAVCIPCIADCESCFNKTCLSCRQGYNLNADNICVLICDPTCKTCEDGAPQRCTSCYGDDTLTALRACNPKINCNSINACIDCPLNYVFKNSQCLPCTVTDPNCIHCSVASTALCTECTSMYYLRSNDTTCQPCASSCLKCRGPSQCQLCADGRFLAVGTKVGQCGVCKSPCVQCIRSPTDCVTCIDGRQLIAFRCVLNTSVYLNTTFLSLQSTIDFTRTTVATLAGVTQSQVLILKIQEKPPKVLALIDVADSILVNEAVKQNSKTQNVVSSNTLSMKNGTAYIQSNQFNKATVNDKTSPNDIETIQPFNTKLFVGLTMGILVSSSKSLKFSHHLFCFVVVLQKRRTKYPSILKELIHQGSHRVKRNGKNTCVGSIYCLILLILNSFKFSQIQISEGLPLLTILISDRRMKINRQESLPKISSERHFPPAQKPHISQQLKHLVLAAQKCYQRMSLRFSDTTDFSLLNCHKSMHQQHPKFKMLKLIKPDDNSVPNSLLRKIRRFKKSNY